MSAYGESFMRRHFILLGSAYSGLSVALGAFGAHYLKNILSIHSLEVFETAVKYQMYHGMALLLTALLSSHIEHISIKLAGLGFSLGTLIFSGSLYMIVFLEKKYFGAFAPIGGAFLIFSWCCLGWGASRS